MPPSQAEILRTALLSGPKRGPELTALLNISQSTFSRAIRSVPDLAVLGKKRATVYALRKYVGSLGSEFPLFQIDPSGKVSRIGDLHSLMPRGFAFVPEGKGAPRLYPGIPYFLWDHRPQGYFGRMFIAANRDLGFPQRLEDWSDVQILESLLRRGESVGGDLMLGEESFGRQQAELSALEAVDERARPRHFDELAASAMKGVIRGSSVGGDQPKFPALVKVGDTERHVLVKFSAPLKTPKGRRWADLLLAEMHALAVVQEVGKIQAATTEILFGEDRVYLESTRFDRVGRAGRKGLISFASVEHEFVGAASHWAASATRLFRQKRITHDEMKSIQWLDAYGAWIANSDRHYGNLSFHFDPVTERISLAPVYDMLPMHFAPLEGEDERILRQWSLPVPNGDTVNAWSSAREAALEFWGRVSKDDRVSREFRAECRRILDRIRRALDVA